MALRPLVIAGTHSGSGKTSLSLALARALARRGFAVQTFKVGPDFLDPTYLSRASGRPCYNLDGWMAGAGYVRGLFARAAADADVALVEGVMGLFDGADPANEEGSTAEIARWLDAAILLVADVHGMGRSLAALVKGFTTFAPGLRFAGIVANRAGSERHAGWLADALRDAGLPPLLGAIPRGAFPALASRHLGLVTADEERLPEATLDALADALERHLPLETLFPGLHAKTHGAAGNTERRDGEPGASFPGTVATPAAAKSGPLRESLFPAFAVGATASGPLPSPPARLRIGVARDAAFHFYYPDLFDAFAALGAEAVFFSPLAESRLPEGIAGLYLGGGYPEVHAAGLAANGSMLAAIRAFAAAGRPVYAECGGMIYLSEGLVAEGRLHPFLGILPGRTRMLPRRKALGYVEAELTADSLWGRRGETFRGHEFHYSELIDDPAADPAWQRVFALRRRRSGAVEAEGFQRGAILATYAHLHYASRPAAVAHFLERCGGQP